MPQHTFVEETDAAFWETFGPASLYYRREYLENASDRDESEITPEMVA